MALNIPMKVLVLSLALSTCIASNVTYAKGEEVQVYWYSDAHYKMFTGPKAELGEWKNATYSHYGDINDGGENHQHASYIAMLDGKQVAVTKDNIRKKLYEKGEKVKVYTFSDVGYTEKQWQNATFEKVEKNGFNSANDENHKYTAYIAILDNGQHVSLNKNEIIKKSDFYEKDEKVQVKVYCEDDYSEKQWQNATFENIVTVGFIHDNGDNHQHLSYTAKLENGREASVTKDFIQKRPLFVRPADEGEELTTAQLHEMAAEARRVAIEQTNPDCADGSPVNCKQDPLPDGWTEHKDPQSGGMYYWNAKTGETTWDRPANNQSYTVGRQTRSCTEYARQNKENIWRQVQEFAKARTEAIVKKYKGKDLRLIDRRRLSLRDRLSEYEKRF